MKQFVLNHLGHKNEPKITHYFQEQNKATIDNLMTLFPPTFVSVSPLEGGIERDSNETSSQQRQHWTYPGKDTARTVCALGCCS